MESARTVVNVEVSAVACLGRSMWNLDVATLSLSSSGQEIRQLGRDEKWNEFLEWISHHKQQGG